MCYHVQGQPKSDEACTKQRSHVAKGRQLQIRTEVEEGENAELSCIFCSQPTADISVQWFFRNLSITVTQELIMQEQWGPDVEITSDPFTFDEYNRVYVKEDNSLEIRRFNGETRETRPRNCNQ